MNTLNQLTIGPVSTLKDNYVWMIIDNMSQSALMVDPGEAKPPQDFLEKNHLTLKGILITHHHWDHTNGISTLKTKYDVPVFGSYKEMVQGLTHGLKEHDHVNISSFPLRLRVIEIPGHTLGHIAYYSNGIVFTGDTLFGAGCGRVFEGQPDQMYNSLQKIAHLPDDTKIYCGHEYTLKNLQFAKMVEPHNAKISERLHIVENLRNNNEPSLPSLLKNEKETNPFLRCTSPELIVNVEKYAKQPLKNEVEVFTWLRKMKDEF